ncbi:MAG: glycine cleavage system aminomethyltransferase GcvT, partial [Firmicutes bacterium]|nr:glycine cleavage system aminomethyltransferase GcvT [Bacillota bacterium]
MSSEAHEDRPTLAHTPLYDLHVELGGKMVPFAGYAMPVQYPAGIVTEHQHCRAQAALFDVSHMGQVRITGDQAAQSLETLVPGDLLGLTKGDQRYTQLTNETGGILDDLIVGRDEDNLFLVINASRKAADITHMRACLDTAVQLEALEDRSLLALQGPQATAVLGSLVPDCTALRFMQ